MTINEFAELLGNFGEFVGSIAVVATLIYLTVQVRQNSRSINAANYFNAALSYNQINSIWATHPEIPEMVLKDPEELSEVEFTRLFAILRSYNNNFMAVWWSHREGTFPDEQFLVYERNYIQLVASPAGKVIIESLDYDYPEFAEYLKQKVAERGETRFYPGKGYDLHNSNDGA